MRSTIQVLEKAPTVALVTLYEAKLALNQATAAAPTDNAMELLIERCSDEIAMLCNRTFAKEKVTETFHSFATDVGGIFLSRSPVRTKDVELVDENATTLAASGYALDEKSGRLFRLGAATWSTPTAVTYWGGYSLPHEAPPALRQAALLLIRETYFANLRGDSSIRMVAHKESRVMYQQERTQAGAGGGGGAAILSGSPARRAINDLLQHYLRVAV